MTEEPAIDGAAQNTSVLLAAALMYITGVLLVVATSPAVVPAAYAVVAVHAVGALVLVVTGVVR